MATHDYVIANGTGAAVRSDLNDALAAIVSNNSSATAPATTYACPMILTLPREGLTTVNFVENGQPVAALKL